MIEPLDRRLCLDATLHPKTGVLNVEGTDGSDMILIEESFDSDTGIQRLEVDLNGGFSTFHASDIKQIKISGRAGSDNIDAQVNIPTTLDGGAGNDTLAGGVGKDKLVAGGGSNTLEGNAGNDLLVAGLQADSISGGSGKDRIIPDNTPTADDTISGGKGFDVVDYSESTIPVVAFLMSDGKKRQANDIINSDVEQIRGSRFDDSITNTTRHPLQMFGNDGNDILTGGSGNDTLVGDSGRDSMLGLGGKDHFRSKDGEVDTLDGGSKLDFIEDSDNFIVTDVVTNVP